MRKSTLLLIITIFILIIAVSAEISVGVKKGDWVEYQSIYTGTPPELSSDFFRFEILGVEGTVVTYEGITDYLNGTREIEVYSADIAVRSFIDLGGFVIPSNLPSSGAFYSGSETIGNLTVKAVEDRTYAGAKRVTLQSTLGDSSTWIWDKETGVLLEINDVRPDYSLVVKAVRTNIWQTQIFGIDQPIFFTLVILAGGVIALISILVLRRERG